MFIFKKETLGASVRLGHLVGLITWKGRNFFFPSMEIYFLCVFSLEEPYLTKITLALLFFAIKKEFFKKFYLDI